MLLHVRDGLGPGAAAVTDGDATAIQRGADGGRQTLVFNGYHQVYQRVSSPSRWIQAQNRVSIADLPIGDPGNTFHSLSLPVT